MNNRASPKKAVAVLSFLPDFGHVIPLLEIGRQLKRSGYEVVCHLPEECHAVAIRYELPFTSLGSCLTPEYNALFQELSGRSDLYMACSDNWDLRLRYWFPLKRTMLPRVEKLMVDLANNRPDILLVDSHVFGEWYGKIARSLDIPLARHHTEGTYMWCQRPYKIINGLGDQSETLMRAWEMLYRIGRSVLQRLIKLKHYARLMEYKRGEGEIDACLISVLGNVGDAAPRVIEFTTGLGVLERRHLEHLIDIRDDGRLYLAPVLSGPSSELPDDLRAWFRDVEGLPVVYLSFGTMAQLNRKLVRALLGGLARLKVAALWALPDSQRQHLQGVDIPGTVRIEPFVPQPAVLAQPAVRCFVTHAGAGGMREGIISGTPMLCIPFLWDQHYNASVIALLGAGKRLHKRRVNVEAVCQALEALIMDPSYRERCERHGRDLQQNSVAHPVEDVFSLDSRPE